MTKDQIRAIFLGAGFTIKQGQDDLRPYVYDAAYCLLSASIADTAGAKPIYQVRPRNGEEWTDVSENEYHISGGAGYLQRIVYAAPSVADAQVDDLRMLVQRLVHALNKASPSNDLGSKALDYLQRNGLGPSPLRESSVADAAGASERINALFMEKPPDELGPSDEPESQYRLGYNTALEDAIDAIAKESGND
ncbi:hypothetical protein [Caballeronia sp. NK8]|uniref:hypothetical protein n=1 Tax=Caballeronia sp. NK8 TaxID=140098 RepID=UPI001BCBC830|nr:hypothetical protein [Caballeronia sp. NK8]